MDCEEVVRKLETDLPELSFSYKKLISPRNLYEIAFNGKKENDNTKRGSVTFDFDYSGNDGFYENIKLRCQNWRPVGETIDSDEKRKSLSSFKRGAKKR
jgi:hypothetical protein